MAKLTAILLFLVACMPNPPEVEKDIFYRRDMEIEVNGYRGIGHLVIPFSSDGYEFEVEAKGDLDLFVFSNCHRVIPIEEAGGIINRKKVKLKYFQAAGIEDEACPVNLEGYEVTKGRHSWGFVDFQEKNTALPAKVRCNGKEGAYKGVSTCQSQAGTVQEILFDVPVLSDWDEGCPRTFTMDDKKFKITLGKGLCKYAFLQKGMKQESDRVHRLTILGFEKIMIRKN